MYEVVRRRLPKISLGTVYRNLEFLSASGVIQKLPMGGGEARFDGNVSRHAHVQCVECGRVEDVSAPSLDLNGGVTNDWGGYRILGYRLMFVGVCPECEAAHNANMGNNLENCRRRTAKRGGGKRNKK